MIALILAEGSTAGFAYGYTIGLSVVLVVVGLVVPILVLAYKIGVQAGDINSSLEEAVYNTAALAELGATKESAEAITAGLARGRKQLGG